MAFKYSINTNKTKVVVFGARNLRNFQFKLGGSDFEITDKYLYLGIFFSSNGSFFTSSKVRRPTSQKGFTSP